ncbi:acyltransferase family protein [Paracoccus sp. PARArs4]|uniref:acyltransferase family protein n=1 Tax=Paracoccus sp. PARArs4 TaxID=2853442 RepID=UPI0024A6BB0C|nr:acyltransferase family protein [Paracoccus sp. PARArs4]
MLVIANGRNPNGVNTLLRSRALVFIGLISYSLYLWHWPLATLWTYYFGSLGPLWQRLVLIMLSLALPTLSWRFIETPMRRAQLSVRGLFLGTGLATGTALAAGAVIYLGDGLARRFPPQILTHIQATQDFNQNWQRCSVPRTGDLAGVELCPIGPEGEPRILIWGDSHVRAFKEGLEQAAFDADVPALVIWRAGCPPLFGLEKTENSTTQAQDAACSDANRRIRGALEGSDRFDTVLLVGRWTYYTEGAGIGLDAHNTISVTGTDQAALSQPQLMQRAMTDTVARLRQSGRQVFVLRQVPEIPTYDSRIVSRKLAHSGLAEAEVAEIASVPRAAIASRNSNADAMLTASGAALLDPWPLVCDDQTCSAMAGGFAGYFDNNHITNTNAIRLRELFLPVFRAEGG